MKTCHSIYCVCLLLSLCKFGLPAQHIDDSLSVGNLADTIVRLDAIEVEAYQVSGRLRTIPGSLSVLTGEGINLSDGTSLAAVLNTLPGLTMQSGTYSTNRIVIRGMGSRTPYNTNRIRAFLNDIPLTTSDGISTPEEIDLQSMGRLEVVKGPSSALYGSGLGGSINLYTPLKTSSEGNLNIQYGSFNTVKSHLSGTIHAGKTNIWGSFSHLHSDGYRENNHYRRTLLLSSAERKQSKWSIGMLILLTGVKAGIPSSLGQTLFEADPQAAADNWKAIKGFEEYYKGLVGIRLSNRLSMRLINRLMVFGRWNDSYERRPFNNLDDQSLSVGFRNKLSYHTSKTDWIFGTEWIAEQYKWKFEKDNTLLNENRENRSQLNIFTMLYYRPATKLNISASGAINHTSYRLTDLYISDGNQSGERNFPLIISPRIGFNYAPNEILATYASIGHGYSLPSPEETLLPEGDVNPDIKPEQGMQYEIGARLNLFKKAFGINASIYWIELNNLLVTKRITEDIFTGINAGKTRHRGFELMLTSRLFSYGLFPGILSSYMSYTRSLNRFISFNDDNRSYDGNYLPGIPEQVIYLQFRWSPFKMLQLLTDLRFTGDQYLNDSNSLKYQGYFICSFKITGEFQVMKKWAFSFYTGINNLTNLSYASMLVVNAIGFNQSEPRYYYPGLPRHVYLGIRYAF